MENKVRIQRQRLDLTQAQLAQLSGVPESTISEIETGKRTPGVDVALALAKALRCTVEYLFS